MRNSRICKSYTLTAPDPRIHLALPDQANVYNTFSSKYNISSVIYVSIAFLMYFTFHTCMIQPEQVNSAVKALGH